MEGPVDHKNNSLTKMAKLALALALAPAVTAFAPVAAPKAATKLDASIADTLASMEGPEIFWGSDDVLKYHVIEGKKSMDALNSDQKTLNGGTLTYYRKFRKNWLDYAIIGLKSEGPSKSSNWPADVQCDNGVIHAIDTVLVPGAYDARGKRDARCRRG